MENPVEVSGEQYVNVGILKYQSGVPTRNGYFLCRLETSIGGPYYKILKFDTEQPVDSGVLKKAQWFDGLKPEFEVTHWAPLPKIPLDSIVPAPEL